MLDGLDAALRQGVKERCGLIGSHEGRPSDGWMVVDYGDVVVHLFSPDQRNYYRLEELWYLGKTLLHAQ
jgi:ribosome-associated protein